MDSYREHPSEFDVTSASESSSSPKQTCLEIGSDERRMHVRAYNYWVWPARRPRLSVDRGSRAGRSQRLCRAIACFSTSPPAATIPRRRTSAPRSARSAGSTKASRTSKQVPSRSLLSRLTDHYMQIIANRAPIGFEAEFVNQRGDTDLLPRHPDAVLVRRRHDRLHLRRDQLEADRSSGPAGDRSSNCRRSNSIPNSNSAKKMKSWSLERDVFTRTGRR